MNTLRLTLRMLARDLRSGELTVLAIAIAIAVAAVSGVGFLADRVQRAVVLEAHQLIGGDLVLTADHRWDEAFREAARSRGLQVAESASFPSMVAAPGGVQLAEIKAVSPGYPLRGQLRIALAPNAPDRVAQGELRTPASGTAWPDARLAAALGVAPPQSLKVGAGTTAITAIVTYEPARGVNPFALAPRLVMPLADLPATGLLQPGSRVTWRLHLAGDTAAVQDFRRWAQARLGRGEKLEGLEDASPEIRDIVERAQRFLRLAALLGVVLAAVAVGLAARRYMQTHLDACAVMRCLGASERQILAIHGGEFVALGVAASLAGLGLGYLVQWALHGLLAGLVAADLPSPGAMPAVHGLAVGLVLVAGFVIPPLLRLKRVPTVRVLRRDWGGRGAGADGAPLTLVSYLLGLACLAGLMFWMAGDARLGTVVLGGLLAGLGVFALLGRGLLALAVRLAGQRATGSVRLGLANLQRRRGESLVQVVALALGMTALLLLGMARDDLLSAWRARVPHDAPNRFVINIQPDQRDAIADFFRESQLPVPDLEPMVRGRFVRLNGRTIAAGDFLERRAQRLVEREFNLSASDVLPAGNRVVAGQWHGDDAALQFSVEKGLADTLNLHVGDAMEFNVAGAPLVARITSLRELDWNSMRVNFFVIAPGHGLDGQPTSYITSFHLTDAQAGSVADLVRRFPNLTVIDVAALLRQLQAMLDQVVHAVELVFGGALLAGLLVLYAALQASAGERRHELAVLRALGGRRRQLRISLLTEFATLGAVAGLLAGGMASIIGMVLARQVFDLDYLPTPWLLFAGVMAGGIGVAVVGLGVTRPALTGALVEGLGAG